MFKNMFVEKKATSVAKEMYDISACFRNGFRVLNNEQSSAMAELVSEGSETLERMGKFVHEVRTKRCLKNTIIFMSGFGAGRFSK